MEYLGRAKQNMGKKFVLHGGLKKKSMKLESKSFLGPCEKCDYIFLYKYS